MSFFKRLKDKFAKPDNEQQLKQDLQQDAVEHQEPERTQHTAPSETVHQDNDLTSVEDEFDDGLMSIEEFEELESQKLVRNSVKDSKIT